jgi:general secretion pathway protein G
MKSGLISNVRATRGFTLLELLVVIVIIGLLSAFVAPKYFGQIGRSKVQIAKAQIESFEKALDQYRIDTGHYPDTGKGMVALFIQPSNEPDWHGPYLKKGVPKDPWGKDYDYKSPGSDGREYEISSDGESGKTGGTDAIRSWAETPA